MDEAASGCWSRLVELVFGRCCCRRPAGAAVGVAAAPAPCAVNSAKRTRAPDAWFLPARRKYMYGFRGGASVRRNESMSHPMHSMHIPGLWARHVAPRSRGWVRGAVVSQKWTPK